jgi:hypothetical protein
MLSTQAQEVLTNYLHLPFKEKEVFCPYFINKKNKIHGALRVLIGKGTPQDIVEEAKIFSLKEKIDLKNMSSENIRLFLTVHHLGVDCSGFIYHILDAEMKARNKSSFAKQLLFPFAQSFVKKIITKLRPAENTNVLTLGHEKNSSPVAYQNAEPGDLIIIRNAGLEKQYQHVALLHKVEKNNEGQIILHYSHSIQLLNEGSAEHGVRQGYIKIINPTKKLTEQFWLERGEVGDKNKFFIYARGAESVTLQRLHCLI